MSILQDKRYEELDWLSKATEPIEAEINTTLAALPAELVIDYDALMKISSGASYGSFEFHLQSAIYYMIQNVFPKATYDSLTGNTLIKAYQLKMSDDVVLDLETQSLTGEMRLVKIIDQFDDKQLLELYGRRGYDHMQNYMRYGDGSIGRMHEIADILGKCDDIRKGNSQNRKALKLMGRYREIMRTNEWNIRSVELSDKIGRWISDYVVSGNLAALTNLAKLKVMTHRGLPIYSIKEE